MALELPDYVVVAFNLIGLPWPGIDEDELRAWARGVRQFADDVCDNSSQVNQTMRELADSSESSVIDAVAGEWERRHRLLTEFREPAYVFADSLDMTADAVYAQKLVIIGAAAALAAEFTATQIGAIFTLGADEAAVPAEVISTRTVVKFALEELAGVILGKLIGIAAQDISDHLNRTISGMLGGALQVGIEVQSLKLTPKAVSDVSRKLTGRASEVEETGSRAHAENTIRSIEDNNGHGGWSEVIGALRQMLLQIAEGLFRNLPATISRVLGDIAEFLLRFAEKVEAADEESNVALPPGSQKAGVPETEGQVGSGVLDSIPVPAIERTRDIYGADGSIRYHSLDGNGRATGVSATITRDMLDAGTPADRDLNPSGWSGHGMLYNEARGHLLADRLGGSGDLYENLATLTQDPTNTPIMRDDIERPVYDAVSNGETVQYSVRAVYDRDGDVAPSRLEIRAYGNQGFSLERDLENPAGMFGVEDGEP